MSKRILSPVNESTVRQEESSDAANRAHVTRWLSDPGGGDMFPGQRNLILAHPEACDSLRYAWLPRKRGVSAFGDLMGCDGCDITFFWEGLVSLFDDCPESYWHFCRCCAEKVTECPCGGWCVRTPDIRTA